MSCANVRDTLLKCDTPRADDLPPLLRAHLDRCPKCSRLLAEIAGLERAWRDLPTPTRCETSKAAFLKRLGTATAPAPKSTGSGRAPWRLPSWRWAVAASILVVAVLGVWLAAPRQDVSANDVFDRLIDWNLKIAEADAEERPRLLDNQRAQLDKLVRSASLSHEDLALAEAMLDNGAFLAKNDDPLAAADHFDGIAEQMRNRVDTAATKGDAKAIKRWVERVGSVDKRGIKAQLDSSKKKNQHVNQAQRWEALSAKAHKRHEAVVRHLPDRSKKKK